MKERALECQRCNDARFISHPRIGRVRCPQCVAAPRRLVPMPDLTAAEERHILRAMLRVTLSTDTFAFPDIPAPLLSTHRVLMRWGAEGSGMPAENPDAYREAQPTPLDPGTFELVNDIIRTAPDRMRQFTFIWYAGPVPTWTLMHEHGMSRKGIARTRVDTLHAMKDKFLTSNYPDLVGLVRALSD